jgi:hypothetical protein
LHEKQGEESRSIPSLLNLPSMQKFWQSASLFEPTPVVNRFAILREATALKDE